jgi:PGF-pre-PGF domain-containing protein
VTPKKTELTVAPVTDSSVIISGTNLKAGSYFADLSAATGLPITGLGFTLKENADKFQIIVETVSGLPADVEGIEKAYGLELPYKYVRITVIGIDSQAPFRTISMDFKVNKQWIQAYNIDENTVTLYRYDRWLPLSTMKTGEADGYNKYSAGDVRALSSYFAITGKQMITIPTIFAPGYETTSITYVQLMIMLVLIVILLTLAWQRRHRKR